MVSLTPTEEIEEFVKIAQQRLAFKLVERNRILKENRILKTTLKKKFRIQEPKLS